MRKRYRKIEDVLHALISDALPPDTVEKTDRVLRSTKLEDSIYTDLRAGLVPRPVPGCLPVLLLPASPAE